MDDPIIPCQRCTKPGATVFRGWVLLCHDCQHDDTADWFDKETPWPASGQPN